MRWHSSPTKQPRRDEPQLDETVVGPLELQAASAVLATWESAASAGPSLAAARTYLQSFVGGIQSIFWFVHCVGRQVCEDIHRVDTLGCFLNLSFHFLYRQRTFTRIILQHLEMDDFRDNFLQVHHNVLDELCPKRLGEGENACHLLGFHCYQHTDDDRAQ